MRQIITVSELNNYIKMLIDSDELLASVSVKGEISNFKRHSSGHLYFSLKDESGAVVAVMFRGQASKLKYEPENGMRVVAVGRVSVFPRDGRYQLYVDEMTPDGVGDLFVAFEQLKKRLADEGLFDRSRKKPLPKYPQKIALVTSPTGAAVRDMLRILGRRWPLAKVLVCPVRVQGDEAAGEIASMVRFISRTRSVDLMIVGRGGGSIEDLWPFNEEAVARAIAASEVPVISAVGHEPDVTIADFAADLRAATPSNGAELAVPDATETRIRLKNLDARIAQAMMRALGERKTRLASLAARPALRSPTGTINERRMTLDYNRTRLTSSIEGIIAERRRRFASLEAKTEAMSPLAVLSRGYAIPLTAEGRTITTVGAVSPGDCLTLRFADGKASATVGEVTRNG